MLSTERMSIGISELVPGLAVCSKLLACLTGVETTGLVIGGHLRLQRMNEPACCMFVFVIC